ncbi:MAG: YggT family protein [Chloroflexi bacterium]|nr:YggT family protein [Chloroflexota bacterium]
MSQMHTVREIGPMERREEVRVTQQPGLERREEVVEDYGTERRQLLNKTSNIIWLITGSIEGLIGLRVVLKLLAANPANPFASFIYNFSQIFMGAFQGLTATPSAQGVVLEISSLIAMVVYWLAAWFIIKVIWILFERSSARSVTITERAQH